MPEDSGLAFVVVLHLSPKYESSLAGVLQKWTVMPVIQVCEPIKVAGKLCLRDSATQTPFNDRGTSNSHDLPHEYGTSAVDIFFRTLAETDGPVRSR